MSQEAKPSVTVSPLVAEAKALMKQRDELHAKILLLEGRIINLGAGTYSDGAGSNCQVIGASAGSVGDPTYQLANESEEDARKLAAGKFSDLFDRHVYFTPCKGFVDVAPKLLTPAKARDLIALCYVPGSISSGRRAYIKWSKPAAAVAAA